MHTALATDHAPIAMAMKTTAAMMIKTQKYCTSQEDFVGTGMMHCGILRPLLAVCHT